MLFYCEECHKVENWDEADAPACSGRKDDLNDHAVARPMFPVYQVPAAAAMDALALRIVDEATALLIVGDQPAHVAKARGLLKFRVIELLKAGNV